MEHLNKLNQSINQLASTIHLEFRALAVGMATTLRDDTVGVSTAVNVMSVAQSERQFCPAVAIRLIWCSRWRPLVVSKL